MRILYSILLFALGLVGYSVMSGPGAMGAYLNGVFPERAPGFEASWYLEDLIPGIDIPAPVRIIDFPEENHILVLSKGGMIHSIDVMDLESEIVLDISDRTFKLGDCGTVGIALHPEFDPGVSGNKSRVFLFYKTKPNVEEWDAKGFNRLSSFDWNAAEQRFDAGSEQILIQQYDRSTWHDGGAMFFGPDGFLYLALGDEGAEDHQLASTQRLDGGLFSGIIRIDVDNDPGRSHPIRRQPKSNATEPAGWESTYSQNYSIPNDNPFLDPQGTILEEFYAIGLRSPFTMNYDEDLEQIWLADVGSDKVEEINLIARADNCQWPYLEGTLPSELHEKPEDYIGNEREVYHELARDLSSCVIGGGTYQGTVFPNLNEKYLFADFNKNKLMALSNEPGVEEQEIEVLIADIRSLGLDLPEKAGITGVFEMKNGDILISVMGDSFIDNGRIFRLRKRTEIPDPPSRLSELGVFEDLSTLEPVEGILPYDVNAALFSDGALKRRWIAVPNDGNFDTSSEQIGFSREGDWRFPEGTVFIKHFELPVREDSIAALETRFLVMGENNISYGLTYKWNDEGTDAILLGGGSSRHFDIYEGSQYSHSQEWVFPSRSQCIECHNSNAEYVLGVKTHQLNKEMYYPHLGEERNQLSYLSEAGILDSWIDNPEEYLRSKDIEDPESDLEWRIRSYLDANCASCHRFGGLQDVFLDFRLQSARSLKSYIDLPNNSHASTESGKVIVAGDHSSSELWIRDASQETNKMPPLGRVFVDQVYVDSLAKWIDSLDPDEGLFVEHEMIIFPNPTEKWLGIRLDDSWEYPLNLNFYSSTGRLMMQDKMQESIMYIELEDFPSGTYFVSLESEDRREVRKLIKK